MMKLRAEAENKQAGNQIRASCKLKPRTSDRKAKDLILGKPDLWENKAVLVKPNGVSHIDAEVK